MALDEKISELIGMIYAPLSGDGSLAQAAIAMADYFDTSGTTLVLCDYDSVIHMEPHGYEGRDTSDVSEVYSHDFHYRNYQALYERHRRDALMFLDGNDAIFNPRNYPDFARWEQQKLNAYYHLTALCRVPGAGLCQAITFSGGKERGAFSRRDQEVFTLLTTHLEKSVRISHRLGLLLPGGGHSAIPAPADAFYSFPRALAIVGADATLHFANRLFEHFLKTGGELRLLGRHLRSSHAGRQAQLLAALRANCGQPGARIARQRAIAVSGADGLPRYSLEVFPLPAHSVWGERPQADAALLMVSASGQKALDPERVRDLLGLTPAEARVAAHIGAGLSPAAAAAQLGLTVETVRSYLKRVYAKTGTSRQNDLAALLRSLRE